jgi:hypothetical protein
MKVTTEDVAQLLASTPPRQIPAHVRKAAQGGGAVWSLLVLGLGFIFLGLLFTAFFFPWHFLDDWQLSSDAAQTVTGRIVSVHDTNTRINKVSVVEYEFSYTVGDGQQRKGRSYTTGTKWSANTSANVRYLPNRPELACLEGGRLNEVGWGGAFVIIFPFVGAGVVTGFFISRRNTRRLLHSGQVTEVDVVSIDRTNTRINNRYVYKIFVRSPALLNGRPIAVRRSDPSDVDFAQKRLSDKQAVYVLYNPADPRKLIFPETLIGR